MSDVSENFFLLKNSDDDDDYCIAADMRTHIGKVKYDPSRHTHIFGAIDKFFFGQITTKKKKVIVRQIDLNKISKDSLTIDENATNYLINNEITYVLKMKTPVHENNFSYFFYEFYEYTLHHFCMTYDSETREDILKTLLIDLMTGINLMHLNNVAVSNLLPKNVAIRREDGKLKAKIFNLSNAVYLKKSNNAADYIAKDVKDFGLLILLLFLNEADIQDTLSHIQSMENLKDKTKYIYEKLKDVEWLKPRNVMLLSDLIAYMIEAKPSIDLNISEFQKHPYFWNDRETKKYFDIVNSRININCDAKNKEQIIERIKQLNADMPELKLFEELNEEFFPFLKNIKDDDWSGLVRLIRNKMTHYDDDSGNEETTDENSENKVQEMTSKQEKEQALKKLNDFFDSHDGPSNYFLNTFSDLLYNLFDHFRNYKKHRKVKEFYPKCFLNDKPDQTLDTSNKCFADSVLSIAISEPNQDGTATATTSESSVQYKNHPNPSTKSRNDEERVKVEKQKNIKLNKTRTWPKKDEKTH